MLLAGCWEAIFWWKVEAPALSRAFQLWSKQMGKKIGPHVVGAKLELYAVLISDHANGDNNGFGNVVSIPSSHQHATDGDKDISMMKSKNKCSETIFSSRQKSEVMIAIIVME